MEHKVRAFAYRRAGLRVPNVPIHDLDHGGIRSNNSPNDIAASGVEIVEDANSASMLGQMADDVRTNEAGSASYNVNHVSYQAAAGMRRKSNVSAVSKRKFCNLDRARLQVIAQLG